MMLRPAPPNHGVRFRRLDLAHKPTIIAHHHRVVETQLATSIGCRGAVVSTIEHLMAALLGIGVDNVLVELEGAEVPIFDGSAARYLDLLQEAGLRQQCSPRSCLTIARPFAVNEGDAYVKASPSDTLQIHYSIDFPHPLVGRQEFSWEFTADDFIREIAQARTFGFLKDVQKLQSMGLARGGSLANAIVFDDRGLLNREGFRYADECVRHKILDFVGDLALVGMPLRGRFEAYKAGHTLHNRFLERLITKPDLYAVLTPAAFTSPLFSASTLPAFSEPFNPAVPAF